MHATHLSTYSKYVHATIFVRTIILLLVTSISVVKIVASNPATMTELVGNKHTRDCADMEPGYVNFIVGGRHFSMEVSDIEEYPDSYFNAALKKEWHDKSSNLIVINREGSLFKFVVDFHSYGKLPLPSPPIVMDTILAIQAEADFYNLPQLIKACNDLLVEQIRAHPYIIKNMECDSLPGGIHDGNLIDRVRMCWEPFCLKSDMFNVCIFQWTTNLHKQSTVMGLEIAQLLLDAEVTENGRIVPANKLHKDIHRHFTPTRNNYNPFYYICKECAHLNTHRNLEVKLRRLAIVQPGEPLVVNVAELSERMYGCFVWVLNSAFEGGCIDTHMNGHRVMSLSQANQWMMVRRDCTITTSPVTGGTQVVVLGTVGDLMFRSDSDFLSDPFISFPTAQSESAADTEVEVSASGNVSSTSSCTKDKIESADVGAGAVTDYIATLHGPQYNGAFIPLHGTDRDDQVLSKYLRSDKHKLHGVRATLDKTSANVKALVAALDKELAKFDDVVICLSKLYSLTHVDASALEGGDADLYDLVANDTVADGMISDDSDTDSMYSDECEDTEDNTAHKDEDVIDSITLPAGEDDASADTEDVQQAAVVEHVYVYDVSFILVEVDRHMRTEERCQSRSGYIPDLNFGAKKQTSTRRTKLIVPLNFTSEVVSTSVDDYATREHLLTGMKISMRVVDEVCEETVVGVAQESV